MFEPSALDWNRRIGTLLNLWPVTADNRWRPVGGWRVADAPWRVGWPAFWLEPALRSAERRYIGTSLLQPPGRSTWQVGEASAVRTIGSEGFVGAGAILIWGALAAYPAWGTWRGSWDEVRPGLVGLDRALGRHGTLEALDAVVADADVASAFQAQGADRRRTSEIFLLMATRVDPEPSHIAYRQLVHASMTGEPLPPTPPEGYGPWARGAALLRFADAVRARRAASAIGEAWELLHLGGGAEFQPLLRVHHLALHPDDGPQALRAAARAVLDGTEEPGMSLHPLHARLRMVAEAERYDGSAHLLAARELAALGRQREALALLADAAICAAPIGAPVLGDVFTAAATFGRELGLDRLAERAERFAAAVR